MSKNVEPKNPDFTKVNEKTFVDIPSSVPAVAFELPRVGISNRPIILTVSDPFTGSRVTLPCAITIDCSLRARQRGLHMSRIEEAFDEVRSAGLGVGELTRVLAELVQKTQDQERCTVSLAADYEHRVAKNRSGKSSVELIKFLSSSALNGSSLKEDRALSVPFINACPCTQRWGMRSFFNALQRKGYGADVAEDIVRCAPLQAHTNRGNALLKIHDGSVTFSDLYQVLDNAVPIIRELLKGIDEDGMVTAAHQAGQFCEDNARAIILETAKFFGNRLSPETLFEAAVEVDESVHFHNLRAGYQGNLGAVLALAHS